MLFIYFSCLIAVPRLHLCSMAITPYPGWEWVPSCWSRSPDCWVWAGSVHFKCVLSPLPELASSTQKGVVLEQERGWCKCSAWIWAWTVAALVTFSDLDGFWCAACLSTSSDCPPLCSDATPGLSCLYPSQLSSPLSCCHSCPSVELCHETGGGQNRCLAQAGAFSREAAGNLQFQSAPHPVTGISKHVRAPHEWSPGFPQPVC